MKNLIDRKLCVLDSPANISHEHTGISHISTGHIVNEEGEDRSENDGDKYMHSYGNEEDYNE